MSNLNTRIDNNYSQIERTKNQIDIIISSLRITLNKALEDSIWQVWHTDITWDIADFHMNSLAPYFDDTELNKNAEVKVQDILLRWYSVECWPDNIFNPWDKLKVEEKLVSQIRGLTNVSSIADLEDISDKLWILYSSLSDSESIANHEVVKEISNLLKDRYGLDLFNLSFNSQDTNTEIIDTSVLEWMKKTLTSDENYTKCLDRLKNYVADPSIKDQIAHLVDNLDKNSEEADFLKDILNLSDVASWGESMMDFYKENLPNDQEWLMQAVSEVNWVLINRLIENPADIPFINNDTLEGFVSHYKAHKNNKSDKLVRFFESWMFAVYFNNSEKPECLTWISKIQNIPFKIQENLHAVQKKNKFTSLNIEPRTDKYILCKNKWDDKFTLDKFVVIWRWNRVTVLRLSDAVENFKQFKSWDIDKYSIFDFDPENIETVTENEANKRTLNEQREHILWVLENISKKLRENTQELSLETKEVPDISFEHQTEFWKITLEFEHLKRQLESWKILNSEKIEEEIDKLRESVKSLAKTSYHRALWRRITNHKEWLKNIPYLYVYLSKDFDTFMKYNKEVWTTKYPEISWKSYDELLEERTKKIKEEEWLTTKKAERLADVELRSEIWSILDELHDYAEKKVLWASAGSEYGILWLYDFSLDELEEYINEVIKWIWNSISWVNIKLWSMWERSSKWVKRNKNSWEQASEEKELDREFGKAFRFIWHLKSRDMLDNVEISYLSWSDFLIRFKELWSMVYMSNSEDRSVFIMDAEHQDKLLDGESTLREIKWEDDNTIEKYFDYADEEKSFASILDACYKLFNQTKIKDNKLNIIPEKEIDFKESAFRLFSELFDEWMLDEPLSNIWTLSDFMDAWNIYIADRKWESWKEYDRLDEKYKEFVKSKLKAWYSPENLLFVSEAKWAIWLSKMWSSGFISKVLGWDWNIVSIRAASLLYTYIKELISHRKEIWPNWDLTTPTVHLSRATWIFNNALASYPRTIRYTQVMRHISHKIPEDMIKDELSKASNKYIVKQIWYIKIPSWIQTRIYQNLIQGAVNFWDTSDENLFEWIMQVERKEEIKEMVLTWKIELDETILSNWENISFYNKAFPTLWDFLIYMWLPSHVFDMHRYILDSIEDKKDIYRVIASFTKIDYLTHEVEGLKLSEEEFFECLYSPNRKALKKYLPDFNNSWFRVSEMFNIISDKSLRSQDSMELAFQLMWKHKQSNDTVANRSTFFYEYLAWKFTEALVNKYKDKPFEKK